MAEHVDIGNFEKPGGKTDWRAYDRARIENGEACSLCNKYIFSLLEGPPGHRQKCPACKSVDDMGEELDHDRYVRCPKCGHLEDVHDAEVYGVFEEGETEWGCSSCDHEYMVSTSVSYNFSSPAGETGEETT